MALEPLEGQKEVGAAYKQFFTTLIRNTIPYNDCSITYRPGLYTDTAYWNAQLGYYGMYVPQMQYNRYWCSFGITNPENPGNLPITVQLTFNTNGINRTFGGLFVRDGSGRIYVGHTGKIGGGIAGLTQDVFWDYFGDDSRHKAFWSNNKSSDVYVIGSLSDKNFRIQLGNFIYDVQKLKDDFRASVNGDKPPIATPDEEKHGFSSEHTGPRAPYDLNNTVHANSYHGLVVDELKAQLEMLKYKVANDRKRDLYIYNRANRVTVLFEIKTARDTTSMYAAIGQLFLHGAEYKIMPKLVAVFPDSLKGKTAKAFSKLDIDILNYRWKNGKPEFVNLGKVL